MKRALYTLLFSGIPVFALAQTAIPNGNFESWTNGTYENPQYYMQTSNPEAFYNCNVPFNCEKTTDAYSGLYGVKITTMINAGDTCMGYFINGNPNGPPTNYWPGGVPYSEQPTGIRGYYKSSIPAGDTARVLAIFKSGGNNIGVYIFPIYGTQSNYTLFNLTFSPALPSAPDTVIFGAASSDFANNVAFNGSMLQLDSISFTGTLIQPLLFNGSFELWQSNTIYQPVSWYVGGWNGSGVSQTTDAYAGNYAVELQTYQEDWGNGPRAVGGSVSTGYSTQMSTQGGYPFTNMVDTLAFYYKYAPADPNDTAIVFAWFKNNGNFIYNTGSWLFATNGYQYMEIPFNTGSPPDSVIIWAQSSVWNDSALSFVGASLKVDEMHFKSQPLNTSVPVWSYDPSVSVYPNPSSNGMFMVGNAGMTDTIRVYDMLGNEVPVVIERGKSFSVVRMPGNADGIYLVNISSGGKNITRKINIVNQ